ncbi:MAG TPA: hypothetical protein VGE22_03130 [Solimonas sp.]
MSQKSGYSSGLNEAALEATVQRLQAQGYREAPHATDVSQLQPMQFLRRRELGGEFSGSEAATYWQVLWRAA